VGVRSGLGVCGGWVAGVVGRKVGLKRRRWLAASGWVWIQPIFGVPVLFEDNGGG